MKVTFWLLDINYEVKDHQPEVWLWGIDKENKRVLIIDRGLLPYFYLLIKEDEDPKDVVERIRDLRKELPLLQDLEPVERRFFGRPVEAVKVVCRDPDVLSGYSKKLGKVPGVEMCLEDNIRYSMRYLIDQAVTPCGWHEVEVEEAENPGGLQVEEIYRAKAPPKYVERAEIPSPRILGFTMVAYGRRGTPKPERDPVVVLSVATNSGEEAQFIAEEGDDRHIIEDFIQYVRGFDPDIIVGYGSNQRDWPYLLTRAKRLKLRLSVDRGGGVPHTSVYGHISLTGRINIDLYDLADEFPEVKVKTLENIADFLGVMKLKERTLIEEIDIPDYWEAPERRRILLKYSLENLHSVMGVAEAMLDYAVQLSTLVGIPLDHIGTAAAGFRVEWFLIREAYRIGELVPTRRERPYRPYVGGMVLKPRPGIHENIAVLDFKSMYPNIMIAKNLSPDTYLQPKEAEPPGGVNVAPEVGHRFRKEPPGFYKEVLTRLLEARDEVRERLRTLDSKSVEYRVLDARQRAVKVITNASYGYAGWLGARWYLKPVAEATAAWGRHTIRNTIDMAKRMGLEVIYGDTDSVFISYDPERVERLSREVGEELGLEIKPDKVYPRILFTEAKKRYCGLLPDGSLDIVGLEVIRGDWAGVAKKVQETVLEILLKERSPEKAAEFVRSYISDLRARRVPYRDLIIWKTLTKPVKDYKVRAAHVEAAKTLMGEGWDLTLGDKVGYVITVGEGRLYEKARPYTLASYEEIDLSYYVENQVIPAALRILEQFGATKEGLLPS
ncbi:MAG: DNA-directed DNA polymerase [Candidatus Bathyarchaeia archaeon]